jgi:hypothetical protein
LEKYYAAPYIYNPTPLSQNKTYNPFENSTKSQFLLKEKNTLGSKAQLMGKRSFRTTIIE